MKIAIFASGGGSNAEAIIRHFEGHQDISVALVLTNNTNAGVLEIAQSYGVAQQVIDRNMLYESDEVLHLLLEQGIGFIALAGFLWWVPENILRSYKGQIVNIHPSLLPKYGGKGMYGHHIHQAVWKAKESCTGLTIHHVTEEYDAGQIILQLRCPIYSEDSAEDIGRRVLTFEHAVYPPTIQFLLEDREP